MKWAAAIWMAFLLTACAVDPATRADATAQSAGLQRERMQAGDFLVTAYARISRTDQALTVYIEGDGFAWRSRVQPSDDPTPHRALGLSLAVADTSANVVYLAQPCQFTPMSANPRCAVAYWTGKRYAEEVVASMNIAVSQYLQRLPGQRVNLVGYSGGGALAVLIAARRQDVASLRTVAGNLDHAAVNHVHGVSQMPDSLNAIDAVQRVAAIPQLHISSADDKIVPTSVIRRFVAAAGACAQLRIVDGLAHEDNWAARWPELRTMTLPCSEEK